MGYLIVALNVRVNPESTPRPGTTDELINSSPPWELEHSNDSVCVPVQISEQYKCLLKYAVSNLRNIIPFVMREIIFQLPENTD